jgi:hypothetical protein
LHCRHHSQPITNYNPSLILVANLIDTLQKAGTGGEQNSLSLFSSQSQQRVKKQWWKL